MFNEDFDNIARTVIPCGIDEVGRGPVAGPLVVAGVANLKGWTYDEVKDSKAFKSERKLYRVAQKIMDNTTWVIHPTKVGLINTAGIEKCVLASFKAVIKSLAEEVFRAGVVNPHLSIIVDGNDIPDSDQIWTIRPGLSPRITIRCEPAADKNHFNVSAASCIAKAWRDGHMRKLVEQEPRLAKYQIDRNKGYGTQAHAMALLAYGKTAHHRIQFSDSLMQTYRNKSAVQQANLNFNDDFSFKGTTA